ncbi:MAG: ferritin [Desulfobulbaceae bacterium]|nr:ferritin [Desulfobulbaceae bacterium]
MKEKMLTAFNKQINAEMYSAYLYLSMEAYFQSINLPGFATWMRAQTQEEMMHAMKIYDFVFERGGKVSLEAIDKPASSWDSPLAAFKEVLKHEQHVTSLINDLVDLAIKEKDHASNIFLQWFVTEQVEEEASADAIIQRLKLTKDSGSGLFMIDAQLGQRVFTMPAADTAE